TKVCIHQRMPGMNRQGLVTSYANSHCCVPLEALLLSTVEKLCSKASLLDIK
ncbi:hypothetical protein P7K49_005516, partial [Saguinus oedipus]